MHDAIFFWIAAGVYPGSTISAEPRELSFSKGDDAILRKFPKKVPIPHRFPFPRE